MSVDIMGVPPRLAALETAVSGVVVAAGGLPWVVTAVPSGRVVSVGTPLPANVGATSISLGTGTTLQTLVDVSGSGILRLCVLACTGTSTATLKLVITLDGTDILNYTTSSAAAARSLWGVGTGTTYAITEWDLYYRSSLVIQAQQSANVTSTLYYLNTLAAPFA